MIKDSIYLDDLKISIKYRFTDKSKPLVILSHGFASHKDKARFKIFENLPNFLAFDYPGNGESDKIPLDLELYKKTLLEVVKFAKVNGFDRVIFLTESLGTFVVLIALEELKKLVRISSLVAIGPVFYPKIPNSLLESFYELLEKGGVEIGRRKYKVTIDFIKQIFKEKVNISLIDFPIFVSYGENDEIICLKDVEKFCNKVNCELIIIKNADHVLEGKTYLVYYFVLGLLISNIYKE